MVKLRNEIERAKAMLELVKKRDRMKKESLSLDFLIFEQKAKIWDLRRLYQIPTPSNDSEQLMEQKKVRRRKKSFFLKKKKCNINQYLKQIATQEEEFFDKSIQIKN